MQILPNIHGHEDLLRLTDQERTLLCQELRQELVTGVSKTGGHLASNLGAVELTVAIETVFNTMQDRLVFDVGHQSYVHKLLTDRQTDFSRLRQFGGISGFPKPSESDSDAFVAGHASSSVSIALGMARARTMLGQDYQVVALLGDGAATGGMVYEGLNDAAESREPMIIILNDNEMSIDRNVGGISKHLSQLRTKQRYLGAKKKYRDFMYRIPGGRAVYGLTKRIKDRLKRMILSTTVFENMGLTYLGPVDGHDLPNLISLLRSARDLKVPVVVHVLTKKGCGYIPAEEDPSKFHGIGKFEPLSGRTVGEKKTSFSDGFGKTMVALAAEEPKLCAITAAMPGGTGLLEFKKKYPKRLFDVGIAEEHAVSMAGGLAKQGMIPVVAIYSTFLQRAFDQIMQDVALLNLHVVFAVDRAGLVGEDGATHHGTFDVGFLRQVPGMTVLCPATIAEQQAMLRWAVQECTGPVAVRYPRGSDAGIPEADLTPAPLSISREGSGAAIVTYGTLVKNALEAARLLQEQGISVRIVRLHRIAPLPVSELADALVGCSYVIVLEEVCAGSGIGSEVSHVLREIAPGCRVSQRNLGSDFVTHGDMKNLYSQCGLDDSSICDYVKEVLRT